MKLTWQSNKDTRKRAGRNTKVAKRRKKDLAKLFPNYGESR